MCHTTQKTHTPCQHTHTHTTPCSQPPGILSSLFFVLDKHTFTTRGYFIDSFCPSCTILHRNLRIDDQEARKAVREYRERTGYQGALTIQRMEGESGVCALRDGEEGGRGRFVNVDDIRLLEAQSGGDRDTRSGSRRSSVSSACTLFPGTVSDDRGVVDAGADIGSQPLTPSRFLGVAEVDEFGNAVEGERGIARPLPAYLPPYGDEFELGDLGRPLSGRGNVENEGIGKRAKSDFPRPMPQRMTEMDEYTEVDAVKARREDEGRVWRVV